MKLNVITTILFLFVFNLLNAQNNFSGVWNGTLNVAGSLRIVLHVTQAADGSYTATLDSPDQNATGINCDKVTVTGTTLVFAIDKIKVSYTGNLVNDTTLSGSFTQGVTIPLDFHRNATLFVAKVMNRPQTPKPPFPYKSEEVVYGGNGLQYGGTITIPQGKGDFPAVLLITGSGQQDRDETIFNHKPFAVLADALTRDGFIVLRVDDRGIGNSTGNFQNSTTADFINDVNASVEYLKTRKEVDDKKIGLLGHSEGAMIAPVVASQRKDINFIVLMAAPGVNGIDLLTEQTAAVYKASGVDENAVTSFKPVYKNLLTVISNAADTSIALQNATQVMNNWYAQADKHILQQLGIPSEEYKTAVIKKIVSQASSPWLKYFLTFNPQPYFANLKKVKVLALNGSRDIQVIAQQNLPPIRTALADGKTKTFDVKELPGLNHLFQTCIKCTVTEYGELEETMAPVALQTITGWLNKNVK